MGRVIGLFGILLFSVGTAPGLAQASRISPGTNVGLVVEMSIPTSIQRSSDAISEGKYDLAIQVLEDALKNSVNPHYLPKMHNRLCVSYQQLGLYEQALEHCNTAITLRPNHWRHFNNRGNIFLMLGDASAALEDYERALAMSPKSKALKHNIKLAKQRAVIE